MVVTQSETWINKDLMIQWTKDIIMGSSHPEQGRERVGIVP